MSKNGRQSLRTEALPRDQDPIIPGKLLALTWCPSTNVNHQRMTKSCGEGMPAVENICHYLRKIVSVEQATSRTEKVLQDFTNISSPQGEAFRESAGTCII